MGGISFYIITLGCKVNQYESQALRESWLAAGHAEAVAPERAGLVFINSCAVTAGAMADLRNAVSRIRRAAPDCRIAVSGCAAQALPEEVKALPGVLLLPQADKAGLRLEDCLIGSPPLPGKPANESAADRIWPAFSLSGSERSRAVLKIQDGCSHRCTYCIVPLGRGASVSRPFPEIEAELERLLNAGFGEVVISGVNLGQFGRDLPGQPDFWDLLDKLEDKFTAWAGRTRLRLSSLEPGQLGAKALRTLTASRLCAPQLHLSLQSGSAPVLRRMGRGHYNLDALPNFLRSLQKTWPLFGLGADILTGFPGETDAEFQQTLDLCQRLPLSYAHVFPYSPRPGTPAATFAGQLPQPVKKERAARLRAVAAAKKQAFLSSQLALPHIALVLESKNKGVNEYYSECRLLRSAALAPSRSLLRARPLGIEQDSLLVEVIK